MAKGIEKSQVALLFVTKNYMDEVKCSTSDCCHTFECCISKLTADRMVCVIMDESMEDDSIWEGRLQVNMAGRKHFNMYKYLRGSGELLNGVKELRKMLAGIFQNRGE